MEYNLPYSLIAIALVCLHVIRVRSLKEKLKRLHIKYHILKLDNQLLESLYDISLDMTLDAQRIAEDYQTENHSLKCSGGCKCGQ